MENLYCNLKCIHCGEETPLARSPTGQVWTVHGILTQFRGLIAFISTHGDCYLLDTGKPTGRPFTLSYGAQKEPGLPIEGELPMTDEQKAWIEDFKRKRALEA